MQAVHSMAGNARILYVGAKNCLTGLFAAEQKVIDNHLADVVTNSWGDTPGTCWMTSRPGRRSTTCSCWPTRPG